MKLIIQIPCYNEEQTLRQVIRQLPESIDGIDVIETQIIDDGSTDNTVEIARQCGVDHIISFSKNRGLAAAFKAGVDNALKNGADILVNTDGDNQYPGAHIPDLVSPIVQERADMVIGCRPIADHPEFSPLKKGLQMLGSWVLRKVSNTTVKDATSGFRAYGANALLHLNVVSDFSYCLETLIQVGMNNMRVASINIGVNPKTRESRLFKNTFEYVFRSMKTIVMMFILYRSNVFFGSTAALVLATAMLIVGRYLMKIWLGGAAGGDFWPTIILAGALLVISCLVYIAGTLASLMAAQRKISEEIVTRLRRMEYGKNSRTHKCE